MSMMLRRAAVGFAVPMLVLAASCDVQNHDYAHCDYLQHRCRTVCDQWCDDYGCYPDCHDECWDECELNPPSDITPPSTAATDAAAPDASTTPPPSYGTGVLCSPCTSNADCVQGSLCIVPGGTPTASDAGDASADAGPSPAPAFCGSSCRSANDCPQNFTCVQIGTARQCLPTANGCQ